MLKRMICPRIVLAGVMAVLACFARGAETLKIGMMAPLTGPAAEPVSTKLRAQSSLLKK
jgi:hypothetical protein